MTRPTRTPSTRRRQTAQKKPLYLAQQRLITAAELRFLRTGLQPAVGERFFIAVQVPLTALLAVPPEEWDRAAGRRIRQKRVDFVLAYPATFKIAAAIELDDLSHQQEARQTRDQFVDAAFSVAGIPLIRLPVYKRYDPERIRSIINRALQNRTPRRRRRSRS